MRDNPDLDEAMATDFGTATKKRRRKRRSTLNADQIRRMAFRCLSLLSKLDEPSRRRVLAKSLKLNKA